MPIYPHKKISELPVYNGQDFGTAYFPANFGNPVETFVIPFSTLTKNILNESIIEGNLSVQGTLSTLGPFSVGTDLDQTKISTFVGVTSGSETIPLSLAGSVVSFVLSPNSACTYKILVSSYEINDDSVNSFEFSGAIKRDSSDTTSIVGYPTKIVHVKEDSDVDVNVAANNTSKSLDINVLGSLNKTYKWTASTFVTFTGA